MILCRCRLVSLERVRCAIRAGARTPEDVRRVCEAGGKCGWCQGQIVEMIARAGQGSVPNG